MILLRMRFLTHIKAGKKFVLLLAFATFISNAKAQSLSATHHSALSYCWQIKNQNAKPQPVFLLKNNEKKPIPTSGWSLYFNSIKKPVLAGQDTLYYRIYHLNGDLFRLTIKPALMSIPAGDSIKINITVPEIRNFTEVPTGFYLVYDHEPGKGYSLKNTTTLSNSIEPEVASLSYKKNNQLNIPGSAVPSLVFPTPQSFAKQKGAFTITANTVIVTPGKFRSEAEFLAAELQGILGTKPQIAYKKTTTNTIVFAEGKSATEGYSLITGHDGITITASEATGIFYGVQSLKVLMPPNTWARKQKKISIPAVKVTDEPRFKHRGFMLDVARNFQTKEKVLKVLDVMALYKMNVLHFHLNDDEGWRIEIDGLPELTEVGARRGHSSDQGTMLPPSYGSGPEGDNKFGTGYYTRQDYMQILKYAHARHIAVIPEIESPGHARAAIRSMDARYHKYLKQSLKNEAERYLLRDISDSSVYRSVQGWNDNVMNPALPATYAFIEKVTTELKKLYADAGVPLKTIHMGGDEVPEGVWTKSPAVSNLLGRDTSIQSVYGMWKYYFSRINDILKQQKLELYGWEEIGLKRTVINNRKSWVLDTSVSHKGYTTDVWNNIIGTGAEDLAYNLANNGFKVVLSNVTNMYLDMAYNNSFYEHGMNWAGFVNVDKPFYFIPYNYYKTTTENEYGQPVTQAVFNHKAVLVDTARLNIVGLQTALWSETIVADSLLDYMLLPKMLGAAERSWAADPAWANLSDSIFTSESYKRAWSDFTATIGLRELPRLDHYKRGFAYRIPEPGVQCINGVVKANVQLPGFKIRYTIDGTEPHSNSPFYIVPITAKGIIKLKVFNNNGRSGKEVIVQNN